MVAREAFGVVVRTIGLLCMLYGGWCGLVWLQYAGGFTHLLPTAVRWQTLFLLTAGVGLLRGGSLVVSFAYPTGGTADEEVPEVSAPRRTPAPAQ